MSAIEKRPSARQMRAPRLGRKFDSGTDALYTAFPTLDLIWRIGSRGRNKKVRKGEGQKESALSPIRINSGATARRCMTRAHIQTRIWLSIGIFVLGFLLTTIISQVERTRGERVLATVADAVLPAAQQGRDAEMAFQRVVQAYMDTFPMGDRTDLERADFEGARRSEERRGGE